METTFRQNRGYNAVQKPLLKRHILFRLRCTLVHLPGCILCLVSRVQTAKPESAVMRRMARTPYK